MEVIVKNILIGNEGTKSVLSIGGIEYKAVIPIPGAENKWTADLDKALSVSEWTTIKLEDTTVDNETSTTTDTATAIHNKESEPSSNETPKQEWDKDKHEAECQFCKNTVVSDGIYKCKDCGNEVCSECGDLCKICYEFVCYKCLKDNNDICDECLQTDPVIPQRGLSTTIAEKTTHGLYARVNHHVLEIYQDGKEVATVSTMNIRNELEIRIGKGNLEIKPGNCTTIVCQMIHQHD